MSDVSGLGGATAEMGKVAKRTTPLGRSEGGGAKAENYRAAFGPAITNCSTRGGKPLREARHGAGV